MRSRKRRGAAADAVVMLIAGMITVGVSVAVVTPRVIEAGSASADAHEGSLAADPVHQQVIDQLARLIAHSKTVLIVHDAEASPYHEVLLWMADVENPGQIDSSELALVSFSRSLQAITFHAWEPTEPGDDVGDPPAPQAVLSGGDESALGFCDRWRRHPEVSRRVIASRVASMTFEPLEGYHPLSGLWRITLTWAAESADQSDTASVTVSIDACK